MQTLNLVTLLDNAAAKNADRIFIIEERGEYTFGYMQEKSRQFMRFLQQQPVKKGESVAIFLPNSAAFVACYYGVLACGAIPVPLNIMTPAEEVASLLEDADASMLITQSSFPQAIEGASRVAACKDPVLVDQWLPDRPCFMDAVEHPSDQNTTLSYEPTRPDDTAVLLYTSGTSGRPKGAALAHMNLYFNATLLGEHLWQLNQDDNMLMIAPASHIFGQVIINVACAVQCRLTMVPRFSPEAFFGQIEKHRVTFFAGVPTLGYLLLKHPHAGTHDLSSLKAVMFGGAPLSVEMEQALQARFGLHVITGYGLTEGVPLAFRTRTMTDAPAGSVGLPVAATQLRIVDENGRELPAGEPGEIVARGPQIFNGYHNRVRDTEEAFAGGWFHTGDIGRVDERGYLFIIDRLKEMIKSSGYAIFPAEIEHVLNSHPAIQESAVIGVPHAMRGEVVKAYYVTKDETAVDVAELVAHCREKLATYKVPKQFQCVENIPKNPTGKISRRLLRDPE